MSRHRSDSTEEWVVRRYCGLYITFRQPHEGMYQHDKHKALRPILIKTNIQMILILVLFFGVYQQVLAPEVHGVYVAVEELYAYVVCAACAIAFPLPMLLFYPETLLPVSCARHLSGRLTGGSRKHVVIETAAHSGKCGSSAGGPAGSIPSGDNFFLRHADAVLLTVTLVLVFLVSLTRWRMIVLLGSDWLEQSKELHRTLDVERSHLDWLEGSSDTEPVYIIRAARPANGSSAIGECGDVLLPAELVHYQDCHLEVGSSDELVHQYLIIAWLAHLAVVLRMAPHTLLVVVIYAACCVVGVRVALGAELVHINDIAYEGLFLFVVGFFLYLGAVRNEALMRREWQERTQAVAKSETLGKEMIRLRNQTGVASPAQVALLRFHFADENLDPRLQGVTQIDGDELELGEVLGTGAFCEVYRGAYRKMPVAVKKVQQMTETGIKAFKAECALLHELRHPNIVLMLGAFWSVEDAHLCLVLEICGRGSLQGLLASDESPFLTWGAHKLPIALGIARALAFLHGREPKIIHRDLKPANVLLDDGFNAKLADFGVSREEADATMTQAGTPAFAAPEMLRRERYTETVDTWAFGCILCCMWTHDARPEAADTQGTSTLYAAVIRNMGTGVLVGRGLDRVSVSSGTTPAGGKRVAKARVSSLEEMMHKVAETKISPRLPEESFLAELVAACCCPEPDLRPPMWDVRAMLDSPEFGAAAVMTPPGPLPGLPATDFFEHSLRPHPAGPLAQMHGAPLERWRAHTGGGASDDGVSSPDGASWGEPARASAPRTSAAAASAVRGLGLAAAPRSPPGCLAADRCTHTIAEADEATSSSERPRGSSMSTGLLAPPAAERASAGPSTPSSGDAGASAGRASLRGGLPRRTSNRASEQRRGSNGGLSGRLSWSGRARTVSAGGLSGPPSTEPSCARGTPAMASDAASDEGKGLDAPPRDRCAARRASQLLAGAGSADTTPDRGATGGGMPGQGEATPGALSPVERRASANARRGAPHQGSLGSRGDAASPSGPAVEWRRSVGITAPLLDALALAQAKVEQRVIAVAQRRLEAMDRRAKDSPHDVPGDLHALDADELGARRRASSGSTPGRTLTAAATSLAVGEIAPAERPRARKSSNLTSGPDSGPEPGSDSSSSQASTLPSTMPHKTSFESPGGHRGYCVADRI